MEKISQSRTIVSLSENYVFISSVFGDKKHIKKVQQQREQRGMLHINQRRNEVVGKEYQSRSNRSISGQNNESSLIRSSCGMQTYTAQIYKPKDASRGILGPFASTVIESQTKS